LSSIRHFFDHCLEGLRGICQEDYIVGVEQAVDQLLANLFPDTKGLETHDEFVDERVE
jgi:hypothetical protein